MIRNGQISSLWGSQTILTCDHVNPGMPITEEVQIYKYDFTKFEESYHDIYSKLIHAKILEPMERKPNMMSKAWKKFKDVCHYHGGRGGHDLETCHAFKMELELLVEAGRVELELPPFHS